VILHFDFDEEHVIKAADGIRYAFNLNIVCQFVLRWEVYACRRLKVRSKYETGEG